MRSRACAGLREWGSGARGSGRGGLPQPSVQGSSTLSGTRAARLARDARPSQSTRLCAAARPVCFGPCPWVRGVGARPSIEFLIRT